MFNLNGIAAFNDDTENNLNYSKITSSDGTTAAVHLFSAEDIVDDTCW